MNKARIFSARSVCAAAVCLFFLPLSAAAGEVTWSTVVPRLGHPQTIQTWGLSNVQVSVKYRTNLINTTTGAPIACGSTVPVGTKAKYIFEQGVFDDVYWVGTGYNADSPYGAWMPDAQRPPGDICIARNLVHPPLKHTSSSYGILSIAPPVKTLQNAPTGCTKDASGEAYTCTLDTPGTYDSTYLFAPTKGKFYGTGGFLGSSFAQTDPNCKPQATIDWEGNTYMSECPTRSDKAMGPLFCKNPPLLTPEINVPEKAFACRITVAQASGNPPGAPGRGPGTNPSDACVVGTPYSFSVTATDPENDRVRYAIDWDGNGSIDQYVPASGYVSSGAQQIVVRTFATPGDKTVLVLAQDEEGMTSSWTKVPFTCSVMQINIERNTASQEEPSIPQTGYGLGIGGGIGGGAVIDLNIRAVPSLLRSGQATKVTWSATNADSCTVSGSNGDAWTGLVSPVGGRMSSPITQRTSYTLTCLSEGQRFSKTAVVNILPTWRED